MGVKTRRVEKYYQDLLTSETNSSNQMEQKSSDMDSNAKGSTIDAVYVPEKWKGQIEKVFSIFISSTGSTHVCAINFRLSTLIQWSLSAGFASNIPRPSCFR